MKSYGERQAGKKAHEGTNISINVDFNNQAGDEMKERRRELVYLGRFKTVDQ